MSSVDLHWWSFFYRAKYYYNELMFQENWSQQQLSDVYLCIYSKKGTKIYSLSKCLSARSSPHEVSWTMQVVIKKIMKTEPLCPCLLQNLTNLQLLFSDTHKYSNPYWVGALAPVLSMARDSCRLVLIIICKGKKRLNSPTFSMSFFTSSIFPFSREPTFP